MFLIWKIWVGKLLRAQSSLMTDNLINARDFPVSRYNCHSEKLFFIVFHYVCSFCTYINSHLTLKSLSHVRLCVNPWTVALPSFSVHGIFQARILEWVAISFSRRSSRPRDWTQVSHIVGRRFTIWATILHWFIVNEWCVHFVEQQSQSGT